jgi:hypothetical protein
VYETLSSASLNHALPLTDTRCSDVQVALGAALTELLTRDDKADESVSVARGRLDAQRAAVAAATHRLLAATAAQRDALQHELLTRAILAPDRLTPVATLPSAAASTSSLGIAAVAQSDETMRMVRDGTAEDAVAAAGTLLALAASAENR